MASKAQQLRQAKEEYERLRKEHSGLEAVIIQMRDNAVIPTNDSVSCLQKEWEKCMVNFENVGTDNEESVERLSALSQRYNELQILQKYLQCGFRVQECVDNITASLREENTSWKKLINTAGEKKSIVFQTEWIEEALPIYYSLESDLKRITHIINALKRIGNQPMRILQYTEEKRDFFYKEIQQRMKERLEVVYSTFNWPTPNHKLSKEIIPLGFTSEIEEDWLHIHPVNALMRDRPPTYINRIDNRLELFVAIFIFGLRLQHAFQSTNNEEESVWVLDGLYQPIISRFLFHFMNEASQTNVLEKPEWCMTYIAHSLSDHAEFLLSYIQPLLNREAGNGLIPDAKNILIEKLLNVLERKLLQDIPLLLATNQPLYCHTLSECVKLEKLLFDVHNYPAERRSPIEAFAHNEELFSAWIKIEAHVFSKQMKRLLKSSHKWEPYLIQLRDVDELKPTIFAESVIVMTEALTSRYQRLQRSSDKLRMFEQVQKPQLKIFCTDMKNYFKFLAEAETLSQELIESLCRLGNSANYCSLIFADWSESILYLEMQYEREIALLPKDKAQVFKLEDVEGVLFKETIRICNKTLSRCLRGISSAIARTFQAYAEPYFNQSTTQVLNSIQYDISPDMSSPLFELKQAIDTVLEQLASMLLPRFWEIFTAELDSYLVSGIINGRNCKYTQNAGEQLRYDMKVLFSFIHPHYKSETTIFPKTKDCIHVLIMEKSDLRQLHDDLHLQNATEQKRILHEYRISVLAGREVEQIINKRVDIISSRK